MTNASCSREVPDYVEGRRFSGTAQINLRDFGITFNAPPEDGGVVIDHRVHIGLEIEAIREPTDLHGKG